MEKVKDIRHNFETSCSGSNKFSNYFAIEGALRTRTRRTELLITAFLVDRNIPFRIMDHLSDVLSRTFPDSSIARKLACKKTKSVFPMIYLVKRSRQS